MVILAMAFVFSTPGSTHASSGLKRIRIAIPSLSISPTALLLFYFF